jgi:hypothetical protein
MADNIQKHNICTNVPLSQTFKSVFAVTPHIKHTNTIVSRMYSFRLLMQVAHIVTTAFYRVKECKNQSLHLHVQFF